MRPEAASNDRRIAIVGLPGSGKTTLAIRIAERLRVRVIHLNSVAAADGDAHPGRLHSPVDERPMTRFEPRPLAERHRIVSAFAALPAWVAEGAFVEWTQPLFARADTIIWLDHLGPATVTKRILDRVRRAQARESLRHQGAARIIRPRSYARHGVDLMSELWDVNGYYWRRWRPDVTEDIAKGRWDRITRVGVSDALELHWDRVLRVRDANALQTIDEAIGIDDSRPQRPNQPETTADT